MSNVCLVVIFNHNFIKNVDKLKLFYKGRFSHIKFIAPYYNGPDEDIIGVYENSHRFQGYITEAFSRFHQYAFTHYVFTADDLLLNPALNENNIIQALGIADNASYIKEIFTFDRSPDAWHILRTFNTYLKKTGVEATSFLPDYQAATDKCRKHGIAVNPISFFRYLKMILHRNPSYLLKNFFHFVQYILLKRGKQIGQPPYPFVGAYSDFMVIPSSTIKPFVHYCGIFASMNIFVEVAIPTALVLSAEKIRYEGDYKGVEIWDAKGIDQLGVDNGYKVSNLFKDRNRLYYHPVKLSRWDIN